MKYKLLLALLFFGCASEPFTSKDISQPGIEYCGQACDNLAKLGCELGKDNCNVKCYTQHKENYFWNTYCLTSINSCDMIIAQCKSNYKVEK